MLTKAFAVYFRSGRNHKVTRELIRDFKVIMCLPLECLVNISVAEIGSV